MRREFSQTTTGMKNATMNEHQNTCISFFISLQGYKMAPESHKKTANKAACKQMQNNHKQVQNITKNTPRAFSTPALFNLVE